MEYGLATHSFLVTEILLEKRTCLPTTYGPNASTLAHLDPRFRRLRDAKKNIPHKINETDILSFSFEN